MNNLINKSSDKKFFWIGTIFLCLAMLALTVTPKVIYEFLPYFYINVNHFRSIATGCFVLTLAFYFLSKECYKRQLLAIAAAFAYFYVFIKFLIN